MNTEIKHNTICRCPACAGDGGAPPAPTVSTGAGGESRCPFCEAENNTGVFYLCGTVVGSSNQTTECRRVQEIVKKVERLEEEAARTKAALADPAVVWANLLRGTIAMPPHIPKMQGRLTDAHALADRLQKAGQDAIDYIDGKHRDAGRVLDGWRKANK